MAHQKCAITKATNAPLTLLVPPYVYLVLWVTNGALLGSAPLLCFSTCATEAHYVRHYYEYYVFFSFSFLYLHRLQTNINSRFINSTDINIKCIEYNRRLVFDYKSSY